MTEQPLNCADIEYLSPHPEALEDVLWELNHGVLPTYTLAINLSPEALQELGGYAYQQGAMWDARTSMMDSMTGGC